MCNNGKTKLISSVVGIRRNVQVISTISRSEPTSFRIHDFTILLRNTLRLSGSVGEFIQILSNLYLSPNILLF